MAKSVVLTGVGRDRVGIVAELAEILFEMGCNLLDSSMTLLRGEFAIILMVQLPDNVSVDELKQRIRQLEERLGLSIHMRELTEQELAESDDLGSAYIISVYGADKPGIVRGVTAALANMSFNITDVATKLSGDLAKDSENVFVMILEGAVAADVSEDALREKLKKVSSDMNVDITVQSMEVVEF